MGYEESIVVRKLQERINQRLQEMKICDRAQAEHILDQLIGEIEIEMSKDASLFPIAVREAVYGELKEQEEDRATSNRRAYTRVRETFGKQLSSLDRLLTFAELEASRFERLIRNGFEVLETKAPRSDPLAATGAFEQFILSLKVIPEVNVLLPF